MEEFESVKRWLSAVHADHTGSSETRECYLRWFKRFCDWLGKTPDQLIEERKAQVKSEDMTVKREAEETLRSFCNYLEQKEGSSRSTVLAYHSAVKSFYKYNYLPLQLRTPKKHAPRGVKPHTQEEIKALYNVSGVRDRAIVLCLAECGMSREDFVTLKYSDVKDDYEKENETIHLKVVRTKEQIGYDTFLGINATKALRTYIEMRKRKGGQFNEDTVLFPSHKTKEEMLPNGLNWILRRLGEKAGIDSSPHRFRKFFESNLGTRVPSLLVRYWVGHSLGVESSYFVPSVEDQRKAYLEAYEKIDILGSTEKISETALEVALANLQVSLKGKPPKQQRQIFKDFWRSLPTQTRKTFENYMEKRGEKLPTEFQGLRNIMQVGKKESPLRRYHKTVKRKKDSENDCQKIVDEKELETWLIKGWHVVTVLKSGKVIISND